MVSQRERHLQSGSKFSRRNRKSDAHDNRQLINNRTVRLLKKQLKLLNFFKHRRIIISSLVVEEGEIDGRKEINSWKINEVLLPKRLL